jgi:hypothetical protein
VLVVVSLVEDVSVRVWVVLVLVLVWVGFVIFWRGYVGCGGGGNTSGPGGGGSRFSSSSFSSPTFAGLRSGRLKMPAGFLVVPRGGDFFLVGGDFVLAGGDFDLVGDRLRVPLSGDRVFLPVGGDFDLVGGDLDLPLGGVRVPLTGDRDLPGGDLALVPGLVVGFGLVPVLPGGDLALVPGLVVGFGLVPTGFLVPVTTGLGVVSVGSLNLNRTLPFFFAASSCFFNASFRTLSLSWGGVLRTSSSLSFVSSFSVFFFFFFLGWTGL